MKLHLVTKKQKNFTFYTKNEVFAKMYKFWIKTVVLYPKMYISKKQKNFTLKKQKNLKCTFYSFVKMKFFYIKNEVFAKKSLKYTNFG